jgi:uncharacterized protein YndB with AHSA1/START domain
MTKLTQSCQVMKTQRTFPYVPEEIYEAFSDPLRLAKWWGPKDFTNTFGTFEFKVGGDWKFIMHGPDGHDYPNKSVFKELVSAEKVVIQHISPPRFTLSISLLPCDMGTQLLWESEFEDPKVADAVRHIAEPGIEQNLDRLLMHLRGDL